MNLSERQKQDIRANKGEIDMVKRALFSVDATGQLPKDLVYKYSKLKSEGLIDMHTKTNERGTVKFGKVYVTKKGKQMRSILG
jgi:hypothetical protein